ncbi:MAG: hypothetical protein ACREQP_06355 [Candidatus Binatia bacterium]
MGLPGDVEIKLVIRDKTIVGVEAVGSDVEVTPLTDAERRQYEESPYGLKTVDTLFETEIEQSAKKCFMVIGGFKVRVPCP